MAAKDISIIIPVSTFGYFVKKTFENIAETCGYNINDLDIVYLFDDIEANRRPTFLKAIDEVANKHKCVRIAKCPEGVAKPKEFNETLAWLLQNDNKLRKWCLLQHSDLLWTKPYWLPFLEKLVTPSKYNKPVIVGTNDYRPVVCVDHRPIPYLTDVHLFFDREFLVDNGLLICLPRGRWHELNPSPELKLLFDAHRIAKRSGGIDIRESTDRFICAVADSSYKWIDGETFLDGVRLLNLEFYRYADRIVTAPFKYRTAHIAGILRISCIVKREDDVILIGRRDPRILPRHEFIKLIQLAYMTSMVISEDDADEFLFPISTMFKLTSKLRHIRNDWRKIFDFAFSTIRPFIDMNPPYRVFGPRPNPIRKVIFGDKEVILE